MSLVVRKRDEHGPRHFTPAGRSVFYELFPKAEADELVMRSTLLRGLEQWLKESGLTQTQAAKSVGYHAGSGIRYQVRQVKSVQFGHACSIGIKGRTQAKTEIGSVRNEGVDVTGDSHSLQRHDLGILFHR
jgi:hypothetical protein